MSLAPPVAAWVQNALSEILNATMQPAFDRAFDACFAADAAVVRNGAPVPRDAYKTALQDIKFPQQTAAVQFPGAVSAREGPGRGPLETGIVGGFFEAQLRQGEPGGRPWQLNILTTSFIANVDSDASVVPDPPITDFDARRISKFTIVDRVRVIPF
ncbi:hypothetical protein PC9H_011582 [Pleurotus ostreatus]|uniref:Uncharacterized protein n=1 Tax=Pleurotus ostreatus TaxID=5322 RepID=A0A8H7DQP6_PLEOS|nr:uncharacterized protein PC9H_011582 [Pleurotus ostreatus]KAF7421062.1 hypothetical protein PC9H_011582 [Pleurotus ostreatus]KAJ8690573.1 hypothetical protein PTI98_011991 [Pleurotus ostreatus]